MRPGFHYGTEIDEPGRKANNFKEIIQQNHPLPQYASRRETNDSHIWVSPAMLHRYDCDDISLKQENLLEG